MRLPSKEAVARAIPLMDGFREALRLKRNRDNDKKRAAWWVIADLTPAEAYPLLPYLPKLKGKGRPRGSGKYARDDDLHAQLDDLIAAGHKPHDAARRLLPGATKAQIDAIVKSRTPRRRHRKLPCVLK
jgi:hypothetical protein